MCATRSAPETRVAATSPRRRLARLGLRPDVVPETLKPTTVWRNSRGRRVVLEVAGQLYRHVDQIPEEDLWFEDQGMSRQELAEYAARPDIHRASARKVDKD